MVSRDELILTELYEASLSVSGIASHLDSNKSSIQQRADEYQLQQITWTEEEDALIQNPWLQDVKTKDTGVRLERPRSEIAAGIRVRQLNLGRRASDPDDASSLAGAWTSTGDAYLLTDVRAELNDSQIRNKNFTITKSVRAVASRRRALQNPYPTAAAHQQISTDTMLVQLGLTLHPDDLLKPTQAVGDAYLHMMNFHTTLSADDKKRILGMMDRLGWPPNVQAVEEIGNGSWTGLESSWSDVDNQFLTTLRKDFGLEWKEIADTFFVDRLAEELEKQYTTLQAEDNTDEYIVLE